MCLQVCKYEMYEHMLDTSKLLKMFKLHLETYSQPFLEWLSVGKTSLISIFVPFSSPSRTLLNVIGTNKAGRTQDADAGIKHIVLILLDLITVGTLYH